VEPSSPFLIFLDFSLRMEHNIPAPGFTSIHQ
jgi:hypothetical protein